MGDEDIRQVNPGERRTMRENRKFGIVNFERRKNARFSVDLPVEYFQIKETPQPPGSGHTGNASEGGLMLFLSEKLEVGQNLKVKLYFTAEPGLDSIEALAQVVWTELPFVKDGDYRYGVKFLEITPGDMTRLKKFLEELTHLKAPFRINR